MKEENSLSTNGFGMATLGKCTLVGWCIGFAATSFFVFGEPHPNPDWGIYWRVRPLIITPLAGACGGSVFYMLRSLGKTRGARIAFMMLGGLIFIVGLWLGIVLGLAGTMWH